jgi:hypothetical protein
MTCLGYTRTHAQSTDVCLVLPPIALSPFSRSKKRSVHQSLHTINSKKHLISNSTNEYFSYIIIMKIACANIVALCFIPAASGFVVKSPKVQATDYARYSYLGGLGASPEGADTMQSRPGPDYFAAGDSSRTVSKVGSYDNYGNEGN